ncbi:MAG: DUF3616 domain-containing protein [Acidobacteriota bacterium]
MIPNGELAETTFSTDAMEPAADVPLASGKAVVRILMRDGVVAERELTEGETTIGKGPTNDIILADPAVSTSHAQIRYESGSYVVTDLGSRNGTSVNDMRLTEPRKLAQGDRIKMGRCTLTFRTGQNASTVVLAHSPVASAPQVEKLPSVTEDDLAKAVIAAGLVRGEEMPSLRGDKAKGRRLFRVLIEDRNISDVKLRDLMSSQFGIPVTDLNGQVADQGVVSALTARFLREHLIFPTAGAPDRLVLIAADPTDGARLERVKTIARRPVEVRLAAATQIAAQLDQLFAPRLIGVMPSGEKIEALLTEPEMEIGKAPHNHIILTHPTVSNTHAVVLARNGGHSIVDLGSSNGTFVNGIRLGDQAHTLQHGDKVQVAEVVLTFRNPAETTESKTARLSPEILEEIRRKAGLGLPIAAAAVAGAGIGALAVDSLGDDPDRADKKKKKKKDDDRLKAALVNSMSRLVATVVGSILTVVGTIYLLRSPSFNGSNTGAGGGGTISKKARLSVPSAFSPFVGGTFEASGVSWVEDTNTVLIVDDGRPNEVLLMTIDQNGKQVGPLTPISHSGEIIDPEAVTNDGSWFYVISSQGDPKNGPKNSLMRFAYDRQSRSFRGDPEVIPDLRAFLLSQVAELRAEGSKPGTKGGLNIEGLAWDPVNSRLLLGLRSPLINGHAVVVPLKFKDRLGPFATSNLQLSTPKLIQLDLGGQGIRDIDYSNALRSFLIISGATELSERTDFGLWDWGGDPDQTRVDSRPRAEKTIDEQLKPEGVTNVTVNGKSFILVVCDASGYLKFDYVDGR